MRGCPIWVGWAGSVTFHSQIVPSPLPAARVCPSGLNATEPTLPVGPVRTVDGRFHSRIVPSSLPAARVCPSGLNATEQTGPWAR